MRSALAERYAVQRELGSGGMSTVYLADDLKHSRQVAVKVLKPELAASLGAERFLLEIEIAARLRHPHILPLYDSGEILGPQSPDPLLYYVMPYVEGDTLRSRLSREKQLPFDDAIRITREVAGALEYAHGQGVVHRDIKPDNILLESEHAVVADFGIARALSEARDERLTETGLSLGTPAYMSPEQSAGDEDVDGRSDIYSLACVLYEMLTGAPPFTGSTSAAVLARHATDPVPPMRSVRSTVPMSLDEAVAKALAKVPADRFKAAGEFAAALTASQTNPVTAPAGAEGLAPAQKPSFWSELKRRSVYKVAVVYGAVSWVVIQVSDTVGPSLNVSDSALTYIILAAIAGLPLALFLAWAYQVTPDGVQRTQPIEVRETGTDVGPKRRGWLVLAGAAVTVALAVTIFRAEEPTSRNAASQSESSADPAVVVLPFQTSGQDLEFLRDGMVHLLSFSLEGVGGLRKIDPISVLSAWHRTVGEDQKAEDLGEALDVARQTGARYAITGSAVKLSDAVQLTANVHDIGEGRRRGSAKADGPADSVLALVDRLALQLVRQGLVPGDPSLPPANLSRVTTASLPALKAYLAGEKRSQQGRWSAAAAEYERAVEFDSTFAQAMYRLTVAYTWAGEYGLAQDYRERALRFADRLPERDALLIEAMAAASAPDVVPVLERFTDRYPDDHDGWYELGEVYYHIGKLALYPARRYRDAFAKAVDMFPHYAESYIHLLEDGFARRDSAGVRQLLDRYADANIEGAFSFCPGYRLVYELAWGNDSDRAQAVRTLDTIPQEQWDCAWVTMAAAPEVLERAEQIDRGLMNTRHEPIDRIVALWRTLNARMMRGQPETARELLAQADAVPVIELDAARFEMMFHLSGYPDSLMARRASGVMAKAAEPDDFFWLGAWAAAEGRWDDADRASLAIEDYAHELELEGGRRSFGYYSIRQEHAQGLADGLRAYAGLARGDLDRIQEFEEALRRVKPHGFRGEFAGIFLHYRVGKMFFNAGNFAEAERYFLSIYPYDWLYYVPVQFYLGQTYEALGEPEKAALHYRIFVDWWQDADPELEPWVEEGRQALRRLLAEPRSTGAS